MYAVSGSFLEISRSEDVADFQWRIPGSDIEKLESGRALWSPPLLFAGWRFRLVFRRKPLSSDSDPLELYLCRFIDGQSSPSHLVRYWLGAVKGDGGREEEEIGRGRREYSSSAVDHSWLPLPELRRRMGCSAPPSGTLSFIVRLRTGPETDDEMKSLLEPEEPTSSRELAAEKFTQTDIEDTQTISEDVPNSASRQEESTQTDSQDVSDTRRRYRFVPISSEDLLKSMSSKTSTAAPNFEATTSQNTLILKENFKKLFLHGTDHDVLLRVKDKEFRAHRSVLGARSPVFEAMFQRDVGDNAEGTVTVEDVDPDCFGAFLKYVYTGDVEDLSAASAVSLYCAANKYRIPDLKRRCVDVLKASLSTSLVSDVIALAETHGEEELLDSAMAFFTEHQREVFDTVDMQRFFSLLLRMKKWCRTDNGSSSSIPSELANCV